MSQRNTGRYEQTLAGGEDVAAFVPYPLPPSNPPLVVDAALQRSLGAAEQGLSRLSLAGEMLPSLSWFIYAFVRKEAVLSSQIEGTQATLVDLLSFEAQAHSPSSLAPTSDVEEICNYVEALTYARAQLASPQGLPLSMRLLNETHQRLMHGARGTDKLPGEVRHSQNWLGGAHPKMAAFVPSPPHLLATLLTAFEKYIHAEDSLPPLIRVGLLHVQFESIHPYLDGNGRIGRLLISLLLEQWGLMRQPLLYLSLYFKRHRSEYYVRLNAVRLLGDWEGWLGFFLHGIATAAQEAEVSARDISLMVADDRKRVLVHPNTSVTALRLFEYLPHHPIVTVASTTRLLESTKPTVMRALELLMVAGVLVEATGKKRDRCFVYRRYLARLRTDTEL